MDDLTPLSATAALIELVLVLTGAFLAARWRFRNHPPPGWARQSILPAWPLAFSDFFLLLWLIILIPLFLQQIVQRVAGPALAALPEAEPAQMAVFGGLFHLGSLLAWGLFHLYLRRSAQAPQGTPVSVKSGRTPSLLAGSAVFLLALPLVFGSGLLWRLLLETAGLPAEEQELVEVFAHLDSPVLLAGLLIVAVVIAPINEELIFRAGLFRFGKSRLPLPAAALLSSVLFASLHANWLSFLPLVLFGMLLCYAYDRTGRIAVAMLAHGLFNFNTVLLVVTTPVVQN